MAENNVKKTGGSAAVEAITNQFGQSNAPVKKESIKTPVLSFSGGNMYIGLKLVQKYDEKTGTYLSETPGLTTSVNGTYVNLPISGKWWKDFAEFADKMAKTLEGVNIEVTDIKGDLDSAQQMMSRFKS